MTLVELFSTLGRAEVLFRREEEDSMLAVVVLGMPSGRQVIAMERTYRQGIKILLDPTAEELETARLGELWNVSNSERGELMLTVI